jgi:polysaccharide biosynthesis protein PslH
VRILQCLNASPFGPRDGFRVAAGGLLRELRTRHEVRVIALRDPDTPADGGGADVTVPRPNSGRRRGRIGVVRAVASTWPASVPAVTAAFAPVLREELDAFQPDVVHVSSGRLAALVEHVDGRPAVLAALDAWHLNVRARGELAGPLERVGLSWEAARVRGLERRCYSRFDRVTVVTEGDRDELRVVDPRLTPVVIPNGVDTVMFAPRPDVVREPGLLVFTGAMDYPPNVAAARHLATEILPLVRLEHPGAHLALVGRDPSPAVRELATRDGVEVTGTVRDLRRWLCRADVFVCAMTSGTGIKNKLLEAMAVGAPCVATPLATQGLAVQHGVHLLVGSDAVEVAARTAQVLGRPELGYRLGAAARQHVASRFTWAAVGQAYERLYQDVVAGHEGRGSINTAVAR